MELKCSACGSNKLLKYNKFFDIQTSDSAIRLNEECYVCESCRHIDFYATEQGLNKAKIEAQLEKERELVQIKKNEERDEVLYRIQQLETELNTIVEEIDTLTKKSNDENITVKSQKALIKLIEEKNDLYMRTKNTLVSTQRELKKYNVGDGFRYKR